MSFDELAKALRAQGLNGAAERLEGLLGTAWTTSTEMLGELGAEILRIEKENKKVLSAESRRRLAECKKDVRRAWPTMGRTPLVWGLSALCLGGLALFWYAVWVYQR